MDRRRFIKICGTTAALAGLQTTYLETIRAAEMKPFNRVKLMDAQGNPLKAKQLSTEEAYVFHYPYKSTPCFLINLGAKPAPAMTMTADDGEYAWQGGIGPKGALVAYAAICAHQLSYLTKEGSPISYTGPTVSKLAESSGKIVCCEHDRVYDPAQGGKMIVATKQTQPLAAIVIEYDAASDEIHALGVVGSLSYDEFFRSYKQELLAEYGPGVARQVVEESAVAILMSKYAKGIETC